MVLDSSPRITSSRDERMDLTIVTVEGPVSARQVREQIVGFLTGEPTQLVIWDLRRGSISDISADDIRMLVSAGAPHADRRRGGRTAIVCIHDVDFGLSRMFQIVAELQHIPFEIGVFRQMDAAMRWLKEHPSHV
jgi:hypothetical protein